MSGNVFVDGQREDKAGASFDLNKIHIEVKGTGQKYVSRGGLKTGKGYGVVAHLPKKIKICADIGASNWWFYRLHASEWGEIGVRRRCGLQSVGLAAAHPPPGGVYGAHQCPLSDGGADPGGAGLLLGGRVLHLPGTDLAPLWGR